MSVNWEVFKVHLGLWQNASVVYIDEEGTEIPIDSDSEFQEALRLAKMNKKRLNLILYDDKLHNIQKKFETPLKFKGAIANCESSDLPQNLNDKEFSNPLSFESNLKDDIWHHNKDVPPVWFINYMKKFKKDLLHELKSDIIDIVENVMAKNKGLPNPESDTADGLFFFDKSESQFSPITCRAFCPTTPMHNKKKKRVSEKDFMDITKQREVKAPKRLEKLREKSERLEKLCNKTRVVLEEKKRLLEKILYFKQKLEKMVVAVSDKKILKKSVSFQEGEVVLFLTPGGEFTLNMNIINDGKVAWSAPRLVCYEFAGLQIQEPSVCLPKLLPKESCVATLRGRADKAIGLLHFKCILVEGAEKIGSSFTCWARVDFSETDENSSDIAAKSEGSVDTLIDFEKDIIASSEKKIEENIIEIEKRLQDLDLLQSIPPEEAILKDDARKPQEMNIKKPEKLESVNFDLLQIPEEKEENWKEGLEQEEVIFGVDCLGLTPESSDACGVKMREISDGNEKIKKDNESESSCDSELSVICMSEEDENFFVVPSPSKTPSPAQSVHEDKKSLRGNSVVTTGSTIICVEPDVIRINNKIIKPNTNSANDFYSSQINCVNTRMRRSSLGEISESKPKKMKSESTEYRFTTAKLSQPTFTPIPEGTAEKRPPKFTFTGEKKEKSPPERISDGNPPKFIFVKEKEEDTKGRNVPKTDALGRVIYAVSISGCILPAQEAFGNEKHYENLKEENPGKVDQGNKNQPEKIGDHLQGSPSVSILPNAFVNGASNVASLAFNTAKSVINNLQSAFVTEGKTELGKPAYEDKKQVSMESMFMLYEMGFSDVQLNRKLLLMHENDLVKVIEDLVQIKKNSLDHTQ